MTDDLFRRDSYLETCASTVLSADDRGIVLDQTVFYPTGGGQPGDTGTLTLADGTELRIIDTRKDRDTGDHLHIPAEGSILPDAGSSVTCTIDFTRRHKLMRMHSALHILCSLVDGAVTGGQVGAEKSRLDFNLPEAPDKEALETAINEVIARDVVLEIGAITDEDLDASPDLVRTMSVSPPRGSGTVRTIRVGDVDYQPCGGTHVRSTGEIGRIRVGKIENKGKQNRRINIHLEEA